MKEGVRVMALFPFLDDLLAAIATMRERGIEIDDVHSPVYQQEIITALKVKRSPVRFFTFTGGVLGICTGIGLAVFTAIQWHFIVGGKPPVPRAPYVIVAFEFCILLSVLFNLGGMLLLSRLPRFSLPAHYHDRLTEDRYGMLIRCPRAMQQEASELLRRAGAQEVHALD